MNNEMPPHNESVDYKEVLVDLSKKYLNDEGQIDIEDYIESGEIEKVKQYLVGAIDGLFARGEIDQDEASSVFSQLHVTDEEKARYRRSN
ncbi:MAG TPA: hypothetical protein PLZ99_01755 [Parcubacteria group bacterium]|jgi:hypothetical protein|nr:hypothetical protein [Parcubacteria group bacterium]